MRRSQRRRTRIASQIDVGALHEAAGQQRTSLFQLTHGLINRCVMAIDGVLILAAGGAFWLATSGLAPPVTWLQALTIALVMTIAFTWVLRITGSYRVEHYSRSVRTLVDLIRGFLPATVAVGVILWAFVPDIWAHREWFQAWGAAIFIALLLGRQVVRALLVVVSRRALLRRRVVVVGSGPMADTVVDYIQDPKFKDAFQLVGVFDHRTGVAGGNAAGVPELTEYAQTYAIDLVVIALPWSKSAEIFTLIRTLQWIAADVVVPVEKTGFRPQFAPPISFIDAPILQVMHKPFKGTQGLLKLIEDYTVAAIGLVCVAPIMLAAAICIALFDKGPILFRQARVGFNSKPFMMYKFRTMVVDETDDGSMGATRGDARITRIGRFLRRTSIDELPQLFNVLRGEMSIVGPRPHVKNMLVGNDVYTDIVLQYAARHRIKPGLTGWAQINGMRGGIHSLSKASRGADLDLHYIANWSFNLDIKIMMRTALGILVGHDAF